MRILGVSGSVRRNSYNTAPLRAAARLASERARRAVDKYGARSISLLALKPADASHPPPTRIRRAGGSEEAQRPEEVSQ